MGDCGREDPPAEGGGFTAAAAAKSLQSSPGDLSDSGIGPGCPTLKADPLPSEPQGKAQLTKWVSFKYPIKRNTFE